MNKKIPTSLAILIILLVIAVIVGLALWICPEKETENVTCTQEAKICPDGSAVGRTGPNCEFTECPIVEQNETADWKTYTNEKYKFEFQYPAKYFLTKVSDEEISISKYAEPVEFGYFGTDIKIIQNTQNFPPEEWLAQHRTDFGFGENDLIVGLERIKTGAGGALKFNETGFNLPYAVIESNNLSARQLIIISGGEDSDVFEVIIDTITAQP